MHSVGCFILSALGKPASIPGVRPIRRQGNRIREAGDGTVKVSRIELFLALRKKRGKRISRRRLAA
jgi:hypothetical protein